MSELTSHIADRGHKTPLLGSEVDLSRCDSRNIPEWEPGYFFPIKVGTLSPKNMSFTYESAFCSSVLRFALHFEGG